MGAKQQGANETNNRWLTIPRTLCFVINGNNVLLMKRAAHKRVFPNQYNGLGGHIERNEDPLTSAKREILEECGLAVSELYLRAVYNIDAGETTGIILFVFVAYSENRQLVDATDEGTLHWIPVAELQHYDLVEDLPLILPRVLEMHPGDAPHFIHVSYDDNDSIQMKFAGE